MFVGVLMGKDKKSNIIEFKQKWCADGGREHGDEWSYSVVNGKRIVTCNDCGYREELSASARVKINRDGEAEITE